MDTETAGGGMVRLRWRGGRSCHAQLVADTVASYHAHNQGDLALVVQVSQQEDCRKIFSQNALQIWTKVDLHNFAGE